MPPTGGKAYLMVLEDIWELAETDEYRLEQMACSNYYRLVITYSTEDGCYNHVLRGRAVVQLVEALRYKPEGRRFDS